MDMATSPPITLLMNIALGLIVFTLNCVAFLFLNLSPTLPAKQKVVLSSLTVTDAMLGFLTMVITGIALFGNSQGEFDLCPIRMYSGFIIAYASIFSNLLITLERFLTLIYPFLTAITWKGLCVFALSLWITAGIISYASFVDSFSDGSRCIMFAVGKPTGYLMFGITVLAILAVIIIIYCHIAKIVRRHARQIASTMVGDTAQTDVRRHLKEAELRSTVTAGIIIGFFSVSYAPLGVLSIFSFLYVDFFYSYLKEKKIFAFIMHFYLINSLANPIVYIWRLKNCREEMIARICRRRTVTGATSINVINRELQNK